MGLSSPRATGGYVVLLKIRSFLLTALEIGRGNTFKVDPERKEEEEEEEKEKGKAVEKRRKPAFSGESEQSVQTANNKRRIKWLK